MSQAASTLVIGTRGSALAVWQAEHVGGRLRAAWPDLEVRLERIRTTGDRIQDVPLARVGGKALFVKELEEALLDGRVDLAVHSMKDVPADLPAGLTLAAILAREDPRDVLLSRSGARLAALPKGGRVGTSSLRRRAQLLHHRPDLAIVPLRGNLDTRIRKLSSEGLDAIVVAAAGVKRLGLEQLVTEVLSPEILLPAVGQGALGVECSLTSAECRVPSAEGMSREPRAASREGSAECRVPGAETQDVIRLARMLDDSDTHLAVRAERALLRRLEGGCQVPIAAYASREGEQLRLRALVASLDGSRVIRAEQCGARSEPEPLGAAVGEKLLAEGALPLLQMAQSVPPGSAG